MRKLICQAVRKLTIMCFALVFFGALAKAETNRTVIVNIGGFELSIPLKKGLDIYDLADGNLITDIYNVPTEGKSLDNENDEETIIYSEQMYVDLKEFCSIGFKSPLCIHGRSESDDHVKPIYVRFGLIRENTFAVYRSESVAIYNRNYNDKSDKFRVLKTKSGEKFSCPSDGEFGICYYYVSISNRVLATLVFSRDGDVLDRIAAENYTSKYVGALRKLFVLK